LHAWVEKLPCVLQNKENFFLFWFIIIEGKLLKTPEIVPFRLTRDIVDGLGVQGLHGTFRRCAVCVMNLLR
jgi:hypothetical protein